ncbi:MAG TPA: chemotaxis protein CheW [Ignavibacteriales bacterium]|nr:chemotaxis protein CheW [Ignavibacteriales bacterium]HOM65470.1 chemotaxis protein CheW [Ignavibacteriales bacterium]HPD67716.1 chemotaxis protein CheW [Ignavibacteriales bacterium]HRR18492.1 chemotaxis protein CheW [Ignavibacteriales bacterium]HRT98300.1 chemotaxis protein CheW [Ignavibacteriales bacterium]
MPLDKNIQILLVEDAGVMRKMERKTLASIGFENVIEAEDGNQAIEILEKGTKVDLIISDWNMPNKDGFELLLWVRASEKYKSIPFMMATGRGEKKEVAKATDAGVSAFITKPFNAEELKEKMEEACGLKTEQDKPKAPRSVANILPNGKLLLKIAHIQITDHLALGVLKHMIKSGEVVPKHFELETVMFPTWNAVAKALEDGTVSGAFILAPLAMDLYNYGVDLRLVLFAHRNGSIFVRNKKGEYVEPFPNFFRGKVHYIPHQMSVHNMLSHAFFTGIGLKPGVVGQPDVDIAFEVCAPVKMPEFLEANENASSYIVAEPIGTKGIASGIAELQFLSMELWENHPCCVVTVDNECIQKHTNAIFEFTKLLVQAGKIIEQKPGLAAEIGVNFLDPEKTLGLKVPLLKNVLTEPLGIKTNNLYPSIADLDKIQHYLHDKMGIGAIIDLDKFVDMRFANAAISDAQSIMKPSIQHFEDGTPIRILTRDTEDKELTAAKALLNREGKYLIFELEGQKFGVDILKIIEISKMQTIRTIQQAPEYLAGIIDFRGSIIPIVDMRLKLGLDKIEYTNKNYIIVMEIENNSGAYKVGMIVDSVCEITMVKAEQIAEPPTFLMGEKTAEYILGLGKFDEEVRILINIDKIMNTDEVVNMQALFQTANA